MSTQNRRPSFSSSTTSSLAKRHPPLGKMKPVPPIQKRAPLTNITNQKNAPRVALRHSGLSSSVVPSSTKIAKPKKEPPVSITRSELKVNKAHTLQNVKSSAVCFQKASSFPQRNDPAPTLAKVVYVPVLSKMDISPSKSDAMSDSMDETMSSCDSIRSPEVEYLDNCDVSAVDSIQRKISRNLNISDTKEPAGNICGRDIIVEFKKEDKVVNIDNVHTDPQLCATYACDIYQHLRASEAKKRPSADFMKRIQKDINISMRAILMDWIVEVAEEYRLVPETLYLTVNYIDRYLSGNAMNRQKLQLLGVACMMIASKYEEICAPEVEEFCYITDNTYRKEEVLKMESAVLNYLKFEMTAPTIKCFLRRFVRAAQDDDELCFSQVPSLQLECLANYIAELSLLEYSMLSYVPSLIAASAIFLAKFILFPSKKPWNSTLQHYTLYRPSDLCRCVTDLHHLCCNNDNSNLPAIREKYSQHKYKSVAKKYIPSPIPQEVFKD